MPHDLDAQWREENPQPTLDDLQVHWAGVDLVRLEEIPIAALRWFDQGMAKDRTGMSLGIEEIVTAIKLCLHPDSHDAFMAKVENVSIHRLMALWRSLSELSAGRPTDAASGSGDGSQQNGTPSTVDSPSNVASISPPLAIGGSSTSPTPSSSTPA